MFSNGLQENLNKYEIIICFGLNVFANNYYNIALMKTVVHNHTTIVYPSFFYHSTHPPFSQPLFSKLLRHYPTVLRAPTAMSVNTNKIEVWHPKKFTFQFSCILQRYSGTNCYNAVVIAQVPMYSRIDNKINSSYWPQCRIVSNKNLTMQWKSNEFSWIYYS